jgi:hypothetical protein
MNAPRVVPLIAGMVIAGIAGLSIGGPATVDLSELARRIETVSKTVHSGDEAFADGFLAACGDPCWIGFNPGGFVGSYQALARKVVATGRRVIINGPCSSACALFADKARPMVRITDAAVFGFHRTSAETPMPLSGDIDGWVSTHGGYPAFASGDLTLMTFADAKAFWPEIGTHDHPLKLSDLKGTRP